jgi:multidrug efflux pump subunit AcrB
MTLVQSALRRPLTIIVLIIAVVLGSVLALRQMPRDVFPTLGIPTIYVAQPYGGMDPAQMEGYLTYYYEYHFLYITGIEHVESKSIQGAAIIKLQFHPGTDMAVAMAETVSY